MTTHPLNYLATYIHNPFNLHNFTPPESTICAAPTVQLGRGSKPMVNH